MSQSSRRPRAQLEPERAEDVTIRTWAANRATVLVAVMILFALVGILIVISLLHPR